MNEPLGNLNVGQFLTEHLQQVFETMLAMKVTLQDEPRCLQLSAQIAGSVGLAGEKIQGALYLHLPPELAVQMTRALLALPAEEGVGDPEVNDVVGETTNMLAGGLKSLLCDHGLSCAMSTPAVIRGTRFLVEPAPAIHRTFLGFECQGEKAFVELHLKTQ
jgi:CheY-specific phosphatase CheX